MAIPDGLSFDELNKLYAKERDPRSLPFEQFFGEMEISQEQKEKRIKTAEDIQRFMRLALMEQYYAWQGDAYGVTDMSETIRLGYRSVLEKLAIPLTAYFSAIHPESVAADITSATMNHSDDSYFYSEDRAALIAENEANSIWNDSEFQDALLTGKRRKRWIAILDKRTRDTHRTVNGTTIPVTELFQVGDSLMLFPRDESNGATADEIVNCRCSIMYY